MRAAELNLLLVLHWRISSHQRTLNKSDDSDAWLCRVSVWRQVWVPKYSDKTLTEIFRYDIGQRQQQQHQQVNNTLGVAVLCGEHRLKRCRLTLPVLLIIAVIRDRRIAVVTMWFIFVKFHRHFLCSWTFFQKQVTSACIRLITGLFVGFSSPLTFFSYTRLTFVHYFSI